MGHSSFRLKGKEVSVITDPYKATVGMKFPKTEAEVVTISHQHDDHNNVEGVGGSPFIIDSPGEYEVRGASVFGTATFHDDTNGTQRGKNTTFVIEIDEIKVCHLGDLGHKLTEAQVEEINSVDILLVPVGGGFTIGPKEAAEVVAQLEPKIVIPMHFNMPELSQETFGKLSGVEEFLKEMGVEKIVAPKLVMTKDKIPGELQVVVLERK